MMVIENKYNISDIVYLITDKEQLPRIVTGINVKPVGLVYVLQNGVTETFHYEIELVSEKQLQYI